MKILFFISSLENGGAERAMSNITTHLPEGVEADILINSVSENDYPTDARIITLGMVPQGNKDLKYQVRAALLRIPKLYNLKKYGKYDACISFMDSANICNILAGRKYCKTIVSVRMNIAQNSSFTYKWIVGPLVRLLYNKADRVVAVSEGVREALITKMKIRPNIVKTITNGFDVDEIRKQALLETDGMKKIPNNKFIYVMTGRYSYEKAHWHLIRAFAEVVRQCGDEVYLILMGKGKEEAYLRQVISENKLENFVELMPYKKNPFAVLKQCNVFIMPSMFEGYCNALCEALICGLPCIATDFRSSAREILAPDTPYENQVTDRIEYAEYGIITPVCSGTRYRGNEPLEKAEGLLAQAMISLYKDPELLKKYQDKSGIRANQLNITEKVQEWVELVKN